MYKTILAAVDGSALAPIVIHDALELADRFDATVHLFRAVHLPPEFPAAAHQLHDRLPEVLAEEVRAYLDTLAAGSRRLKPMAPEVAAVRPWRSILSASQRISADLIVLGSHGYSGLDRVIGTTTARVVNHSPVAVLVVHPTSAS